MAGLEIFLGKRDFVCLKLIHNQADVENGS